MLAVTPYAMPSEPSIDLGQQADEGEDEETFHGTHIRWFGDNDWTRIRLTQSIRYS